MRKAAIATDSNSGITQAMARELGISVLPMPFYIDEELYFEDITLTQEQFYEKLQSDCAITTSQPAPGDVTDLWDRLLEEYDEVVYIPMSSGLSNSCETAVMLSQDYEGKVYVVNNQRISVTLKQSVLDAIQLAKQGKSGGEIQRILEDMKPESSIYITVDSMEYLKKGGRVTPAAATLATVLNLKPVLTIQGDKLDAFAKVRGMKQAQARMIEAVKQDRVDRFGDVPESRLLIQTVGTLENPELAEAWRQQVQAAFPFAKVIYANLPCSIACHVGMNSVAAVIMTEEAQE